VTPEQRFQRDCAAYHAKQGARFRLEDGEGRCLYDDGPSAVLDPHYFQQDIWAARKVVARRPERHVDIGSRIDGFVAHLLAARIPVTVIDIRPPPIVIEGLTFIQADATTLEGFADNSVESLSSLHACEHVGLGRYGDTIDPDGWEKAMRSMARVLAPGGRLYFAVPVGRERVVFNAHRVFDPITVTNTLCALDACDFSWIGDDGVMRRSKPPWGGIQEAVGCEYGCGLFEFTKGNRA